MYNGNPLVEIFIVNNNFSQILFDFNDKNIFDTIKSEFSIFKTKLNTNPLSSPLIIKGITTLFSMHITTEDKNLKIFNISVELFSNGCVKILAPINKYTYFGNIENVQLTDFMHAPEFLTKENLWLDFINELGKNTNFNISHLDSALYSMYSLLQSYFNIIKGFDMDLSYDVFLQDPDLIQ